MTFSNTAILGLQWGDEGKGKIVNFLASNFGAACRYQGGHNAGHTLIVDGKKIVLHLLPSSICHKDSLSLIGKGVVISYEALFSEIDEISNFTSGITDRLKISPACVLIQPYHQLIDLYKEKSNSQKTIGTTLRGIGPAYEDKVARRAIRMSDLIEENSLLDKLTEVLNYHNFLLKNFFNEPEQSVSDIYDRLLKQREIILPLISDISETLDSYQSENKNILFEGAQGVFLDIDHGTYPYVTSSNTVSASASTGTGIGPKRLDYILGIVKAYTTRVGSGPFPTELNDANGKHLGKIGVEFGATTGRPRRCGWLDAIALKRSILNSSITGLCITKLDVLDGLEKIKICTGYKYNNDHIKKFPLNISELEKCKPIYEEFEGWDGSTEGLKNFDELPANAKKYIKAIEDMVSVPVDIVSTGPDREHTIIRKNPFE